MEKEYTIRHKRSNASAIIGLITGLFAILIAISMLLFGKSDLSSMSTGTNTAYAYYGGDAYTGIQQASADTARNVKVLSEIIKQGFIEINQSRSLAFILLFLGLSMVLYFSHMLHENYAKAEFEDEVTSILIQIAQNTEKTRPVEVLPEDDEDDEEDDDEEDDDDES